MYCQCGCGEKTTIPKYTNRINNQIKNVPIKFIRGHNRRNGLEKNENNGRWKGDNVGKRALHIWVERDLGKPSICQDCGTTDPNKKYQWANISKKYKRDLTDFKRLCLECHKTFDRNELRNCGTKGEKNVFAKLSKNDVFNIRKMYVPRKYTLSKLAKDFNVSKRNIQSILKRETWKHI